MADYEPLIIESGEGCMLYDIDGNAYLDGVSSLWCNTFGHRHPKIDEAIRRQLDKVAHVTNLGCASVPSIELAKRIVDMAPGDLNHVFYACDGSSAVEVALKMAQQYWQGHKQPQKQKFVALRNGYHGDTYGAMSVCDPVTGMHHLFGEALAQQFFAPAPACSFSEPCAERHLSDMKALLAQHNDELAGVIVEPVVQGA
ncbi:MAG: aminotransferase class III-fold pyridoxal phosphate-dependent enzyme, partial [Blastopirellula sp. JB062]